MVSSRLTHAVLRANLLSRRHGIQRAGYRRSKTELGPFVQELLQKQTNQILLEAPSRQLFAEFLDWQPCHHSHSIFPIQNRASSWLKELGHHANRSKA